MGKIHQHSHFISESLPRFQWLKKKKNWKRERITLCFIDTFSDKREGPYNFLKLNQCQIGIVASKASNRRNKAQNWMKATADYKLMKFWGSEASTISRATQNSWYNSQYQGRSPEQFQCCAAASHTTMKPRFHDITTVTTSLYFP